MRRIARLRKPSGWSCATPRHSVAPLAAQCAAPLSAPRTAVRMPCASSLRFYSQQPSEKKSLPRSLVDAQVQQSSSEQAAPGELEAEDLELAVEDAEILSNNFRAPPLRPRTAPSNQTSDATYTPALSSEGLASVGGLEGWWDRRENWAKTGDFAGFKAKKKIQDPRVLETAVRRAVVEALVLKQAGRQGEWAETWPIGAEEELTRVLALEVQCDGSGAATLVGDHAAVAADLNWEVQEARVAEATAEDVQEQRVAMPSTEEADALIKSWDPSWKRLPLADPAVKFAVTKRVFQLTGQLIPDHKLPDIKSVTTLITTLKKAPKPKTFSEDIQKSRQHQLIELPNVAFSPKQVTRGDKAKAIGQYKIIEEELEKRDLQGGALAVPPTREKHWFKGEA